MIMELLSNSYKLAVGKGARSILHVRTPEEFLLADTLGGDKPLYLFRLNGKENTESIAVHAAPGARISSAEVMENTKRIYHERVNKMKILEEKTEQCNNYTKSSFTALLGEDENMLFAVRYFSGPYDAGHFQYMITLDKTMTKEKALGKIANFEKEYVKVVIG